MGDGRVDQTARERAFAGRGRSAARAAATKGTDLGRSAAAKGSDLGRSAAAKGGELRRTMARLDVPWARCGPARWARETFISFILGPMIDFYMRTRTRGAERFADIEPPVVFVANHSSHLDTPMILRALPRKWRQRTAVAAAADYFYKKRRTAAFVAVLFNTVPIQRRGGGLGDGATDHVDRLIDQRWNLLMYPEGTRTRDGRVGKLRSGAAALAVAHGVPIVPIYVIGTHQAMPPGQFWPRRIPGRFLSRRHPIEIHFGAPLWPREHESGSDMMARVMAYFESLGAERSHPRAADSNGAARPAVTEPEPVREPVGPRA